MSAPHIPNHRSAVAVERMRRGLAYVETHDSLADALDCLFDAYEEDNERPLAVVEFRHPEPPIVITAYVLGVLAGRREMAAIDRAHRAGTRISA